MAGAQVAWGIDVCVSSLKAIKLRRDGDNVTVEAFEVIEHDKFLTEPDVDRDGLIRGTLGRFMNKYAVRRETVYIGVPGSMTFARFVKLPPVETKKIPEIVRFEAIQQIPFPLDQVNWDYHTFQQPDSPDVEVGIFAMKKELVTQVMSNFAAVDMPVQGVQMSPLAVYNAAAFDGMTGDKGTVVIDMGAEHTDLVIMDQGRLWLRTINIGGNHFTDSLAKSFKQPFAKAESLKKTAATSKYQKQIYQSMRPIFADLVAEIQRSIGHYNSSHRDSRLERIVCMGNPFKLPNLQKYLQQELKMEVVRLENYNKANVEKAAAFSEEILSMTAAYGLAIQALGMAPIDTNLLPPEIARKMMWRKKQPWFIGAAALVALGVIGSAAQLMMAKSAYASQAQQKATNNEAISRASHQLDDWRKIPDSYANDKALIDSAMMLAQHRAVWPTLETDILGALPQNNGRRDLVIITEVLSEYKGKLSLWSTAPLTGAAASGGGGNVSGLGTPVTETIVPGAAPVAGGPPQPAAVAVPSTAPDAESDHGFVVQISGYSRSPNAAASATYQASSDYETAIMKRAERTVTNSKPYYFSQPWHGGLPIRFISAPGGGGLGGMGGGGLGGMGGGGLGGMGGGTAVGISDHLPWGTNKGPYWDAFFSELTGYKPPEVLNPVNGQPTMSGTGNMTDLPYPVDMAAAKGTGPNGGRASLVGAYQFKIVFKVHIK